uniref:Uncharacterized protein n=1 Tax=Meloidogyne enterolobii TaxID=390850 RepID=A0A6V7WE92_MELEN|nr:unnamed protein product [Meloidogyne enterolobii]
MQKTNNLQKIISYLLFNNSTDGDESVDENIERRVLSIDFNQKQYRQLEQLYSEGLGGKVWLVVKKHLGNEKLVKYIYAYRQAQNRLSQVFGAIESNDFRKLKVLLDEEIVQARDLRGLTPLHIAVLEERHEMVEFIANQFPAHINISDHLGRTVAHYAAPQQNAIYDTLSHLGADIKIPDKNGFSAERYRANPKQMVRPLPLLNINEKEKKLINNKISKNGLLSLQNMRNNNISMDEDGYSIFDPVGQNSCTLCSSPTKCYL